MYRIVLILILFVFYKHTHGQTKMCDTVFIVRAEFEYIENGLNLKKLNKVDCSYYERKFIGQDSILLKLEEDVTNRAYFIFYDNHKNKIEEGFWCIEYFYENHITYFKNGKVRSRKILNTIENRWYIYYYDKQGVYVSRALI